MPGGSYGWLATNHDVRQVANWLNAIGITAFVLKYRLGPKYHHPVELGDAQRAIRLERTRAKEFGVAPNKIERNLALTHEGAAASGDRPVKCFYYLRVATKIEKRGSRRAFGVWARPRATKVRLPEANNRICSPYRASFMVDLPARRGKSERRFGQRSRFQSCFRLARDTSEKTVTSPCRLCSRLVSSSN
jgi:hypothetical protein